MSVLEKNKSKPAEERALREMERLGLDRVVIHERYYDPTPHGQYRGLMSAKTIVMLFTKSDRQKIKENKLLMDDPIVKSMSVAIGVSKCDFRDQFNKSIGRTIATGRALKIYKSTQISVPSHC